MKTTLPELFESDLVEMVKRAREILVHSVVTDIVKHNPKTMNTGGRAFFDMVVMEVYSFVVKHGPTRFKNCLISLSLRGHSRLHFSDVPVFKEAVRKTIAEHAAELDVELLNRLQKKLEDRTQRVPRAQRHAHERFQTRTFERFP